jgi:hypothetical protein
LGWGIRIRGEELPGMIEPLEEEVRVYEQFSELVPERGCN